MANPTIEKTCLGCGKPFQHQARYQSNRDYCSRSCRLRAWRKARRTNEPEKVRAEDRAYYRQHREQRLAQMRRYDAKYPERKKERTRQYYAANREKIRADRLAYHYANREAHNATMRIQNQRARVTHPWRELLHAAKARARIKKLPFTLTKEWAASRWTGRCEVTGLEFKLGLVGTGPQVWSPSIDRINPRLGYTPENSRFVLVAVNIFKMTGTDENMMIFARAIVENFVKKRCR